MIKTFYFGPSGKRLFGIYHSPLVDQHNKWGLCCAIILGMSIIVPIASTRAWRIYLRELIASGKAQVTVILDSDHMFTLKHLRDKLINEVCGWLEAKYSSQNTKQVGRDVYDIYKVEPSVQRISSCSRLENEETH